MSADAYAWSGSAPPNKAIVLFSDGTGNSSAKLFKTNVWRMYEAVDLGPPAPDRAPADRLLRRRRRHVVVQAAGRARRRVRLGPEAERPRHLQVRLPQLRAGRRHLRLRLQPRRVHHPPGRGADRVGRAGAVGRRERARAAEPRARIARSAALAAAPPAVAHQAVSEGSATRSSRTILRQRRANAEAGRSVRRRLGHRLGLRRADHRDDAGHRQLDLPAQHARLRAEPGGAVRAPRAGARRRARRVPSAAVGRGPRRQGGGRKPRGTRAAAGCSRCGSPACTPTSAAATRTRASATCRCSG